MSGPTSPSPPPDAFLDLAEKVMDVLQHHELDALVIGGFALAAHNYSRTTEDLDLGVNAEVSTLMAIRDDLSARGYTAVLHQPDGNDPLGGVIDVGDANGALVQIVNFHNPPGGGFPRAIKEALMAAAPPLKGSRLRVIPLAHLIALKLYAGGEASKSDVRELLRANPQADVDGIKRLCQTYRLPTDGVF